MRLKRQFGRSNLTLGLAVAATWSLSPSDAQASTFILGADIFRNYTYGSTTVPAAPYNGQLVGAGVSDSLLFFGIDQSLALGFGQSYAGHVRATASAAEEEAAWLAAYALSQGAPSNDPTIRDTVEGPITTAIWQLAGTMSIPNDPAAQSYITMAQNARANGQITSWFLNQVQIFVPDHPSVSQFMTAVSSTPEPGSVLLFVVACFSSAWAVSAASSVSPISLRQ